MIYKFTSIKRVIAKIIRDTGNNLRADTVDMLLEWIPEALAEMETPMNFVTKSTPPKNNPKAFITENHVKCLPNDLVILQAVENEYGQRVRSGSDVTDIREQTSQYHNGTENAQMEDVRVTSFRQDASEIYLSSGDSPQNTSVPWDGSDVKKVQANQNVVEFYKINGNYIQTSASSMFLRLHYLAYPLDEEGYLLIPDISECREAVYWYVISKLIAIGYKHPVIPSSLQGMGFANNKFEEYAGRAIGKMTMPDDDKMVRLRDGFAQRLISPSHFYDDFFIGAEQKQAIFRI